MLLNCALFLIQFSFLFHAEQIHIRDLIDKIPASIHIQINKGDFMTYQCRTPFHIYDVDDHND